MSKVGTSLHGFFEAVVDVKIMPLLAKIRALPLRYLLILVCARARIFYSVLKVNQKKSVLGVLKYYFFPC